MRTTTLDSLIGESGTPDSIKIDVEGHEKEVIRGLSRAVPLLSFEANLPEFCQETIEVVDRICAVAGKVVFQVREAGGFILPGWVAADEIKNVIRGPKPLSGGVRSNG